MTQMLALLIAFLIATFSGTVGLTAPRPVSTPPLAIDPVSQPRLITADGKKLMEGFAGAWSVLQPDTPLTFLDEDLYEPDSFEYLFEAGLDDKLSLSFYQFLDDPDEYWVSVDLYLDEVEEDEIPQWEAYFYDVVRAALLGNAPEMTDGDLESAISQLADIIEQQKAGEVGDDSFYVGDAYCSGGYSAEYSYYNSYLCLLLRAD